MLLDGGPNPYVKESSKSVYDFIKEPELKSFFLDDVDKLLEIYEDGKPENKPGCNSTRRPDTD